MAEYGHRGQGNSRRGLLRAGAGAAAALGVGGIGYAAFRLGSGKGPVGTDSESDGGSGAAGGSTASAGPTGTSARVSTAPGFDDSSLTGPHVYQRRSNPDRTIVSTDSGKQVAVLTDGARTVVFTGPSRTFTEPATTTAVVTTDAWVRLAPHFWHEGAQDSTWFQSWFHDQLGSTSPDLFGLYSEYAAGAPNRYDSSGVRYAGAARFGELTSVTGHENPLGDRDDRADFYDYLGIEYSFPDGTGKPTSEWYGDLDCSGLIRILYGYRMGYPMLLGDGSSDDAGGSVLPRHSFSLADNGPGVMLFGDGSDSQPSDTQVGRLLPGDLLFFAEGSDPSSIDHCGMYFDDDQYGRHRYISCRMGANGPTFGDKLGLGTVGGSGIYSKDLRSARRI